MPTTTPLRPRWAALVLVLVWGGCSLVVDPPLAPLECAMPDGGEDPCPTGLACMNGQCVLPPKGPCDDGPNDNKEMCNGFDDNCNGEIDEGLESDADGDGFTWCGTLPGGGIAREAVDCNDFEPTSNPDAREVCDGKDNDCDGKTDEQGGDRPLCPGEQECLGQRCVVPSCVIPEAGIECPEGTRCASTGECVRGPGCDEDSCGPNEVCDADSGTCVGSAQENGSPCVSDDECRSGTCFDVTALRMRMPNERVCGEACCSDDDCRDTEFCFVSGSGARSCLPKALDPRATQTVSPSCAADADCSGDDACVVRDAQRIEGEGFWTVADLDAAVCSGPRGTSPVGGYCEQDADCGSGVCESGFGFFPLCSTSCRTSEDCRGLVGDIAMFCRYQPFDAGFDLIDYSPVCVVLRETTATLTQGEVCTASSQCLDQVCLGPRGSDTGVCTDTCCENSQCGDRATCRPIAFGNHYEMRCIPDA